MPVETDERKRIVTETILRHVRPVMRRRLGEDTRGYDAADEMANAIGTGVADAMSQSFDTQAMGAMLGADVVKEAIWGVHDTDELKVVHDALVEYEAKLAKQSGTSAYVAIERRARKLRLSAKARLA